MDFSGLTAVAQSQLDTFVQALMAGRRMTLIAEVLRQTRHRTHFEQLLDERIAFLSGGSLVRTAIGTNFVRYRRAGCWVIVPPDWQLLNVESIARIVGGVAYRYDTTQILRLPLATQEALAIELKRLADQQRRTAVEKTGKDTAHTLLDELEAKLRQHIPPALSESDGKLVRVFLQHGTFEAYAAAAHLIGVRVRIVVDG